MSELNLIPHFGLIISILCIFYAYKKLPIYFYIFTLALYFSCLDCRFIFWTFFTAASIILTIPALRRHLITKYLIKLIAKLGLLPKISETEKIALTSGTIWVDGQLFSGRPDFKWIFSQKYPQLSAEEKSFLDNEVEEVCKICSDYEVQVTRDLPEKVWQFLRDKKFFGMIIPKEFGGLGFSAYGHGCVVEKLASRSVPLAITVMVPNSLGPAELLLHYGTKEQRNHYLPRLADGRELPCFALTEPTAGSDATSIISNGVLFKDENGVIKIRLNWNKRYITLGAYATLIGVAFQLRDPDKILFDKEEAGITCALVPSTTKGVRQGRRHDPLNTPFVNSPLNGDNVVIGLDAIIGGQDGLGKGWKMLMECLAAGRGISLPSTSAGGSKLVTRAATAYSAIRQQFGTSVGKFEGIEEVLARIAARTYAIDAMRSFTAGAIDSGSKPAVITAIAKYHATEIFRQNINDGMDILGGRAIIRGPRNLLANAYFSTPISITVEGANIMTRSLIHFGQGAIMCHPYAYKEIEALEKNDLAAFDRAFFAHVNHLISNLTRSILLSITRGYFRKPFKRGIINKYERKIAWVSATFALLADFALARFGGNLKRKEKINGRFGDALSAMYFSVCLLKKFAANGHKKEEEALLEYSIKEQLGKAQHAIEGLYQNLFEGVFKWLMIPFTMWARFNSFTCPTSDNLDHKIVKNLIRNSETREALTAGIFITKDKNDNLGRVENAFDLYEKTQFISDKIKAAIKDKTLPRAHIEDLTTLAKEKSIITAEEFDLFQNAQMAILDAMQVDEYSLEDYKKI
ncbi:MAG: acyl-CoA dehydrogenase [Rickettsiales bacterium]|nr:acyl-CoA dehydrogenase [Rickettsiales bacterium]